MRTPAKRLLALILTTSVIGLVWLSRPPEHRLLDKSVPVPGVHPIDREDDYYWLSDHDLLVFHWVRVLSWTTARRDVRAGAETPLPALTSLFRRTGGQPDSVKVSPDGTRLIWAGIGKVIYGATTDGQHCQQWPYGQDEVGISYWLNDSRHFLRYTGYDIGYDPALARGARLRSVDDPPGAKTLPWLRRDWAVPGPLAAGERLFAEAGGDGGPDDANVTLSRLTLTGVQQTGRNVSLPPGDSLWGLSDARFGSEGNVLIWTTVRRSPAALPALFQSLLLRLGWHPKSYRTLGVFVSRADGTRWHFVGDWEQSELNDYTDYYGNHPHNFRWVPGHKRLSFEQQGALYTAPAD